MNITELKQLVLPDSDFEKNAISDLQRRFDEEMKKPFDKRDQALISELSKTIAELSEADREEIIRDGINKLVPSAKPHKTFPIKRTVWRRIASAAACFAVCCLMFAHLLPVTAGDNGGFSVPIYFLVQGITIDFSRYEENPDGYPPLSTDDPYGVGERAAKYGIFAEVPHYMPSGYEMITDSGDVPTGMYRSYTNAFKKGDSIIAFFYEYISDENMQAGWGIPSDYHNITQDIVNNKLTIFSKEDNQYNAIYKRDNVIYLISTQNLDYEEADKILESMY